MTEQTTDSVRDRALAAWHEREQEMMVERERRQSEQALQLLRNGLGRVVAVLSNGTRGNWLVNDYEMARDQAANDYDDYEMARDQAANDYGIEVLGHGADPGRPGWVHFLIGGDFALRFSMDGWATSLIDFCGECAGIIDHGRVDDLSALGRALADAEENPRGMHRCPPPEPEWEGEMTLGAAMAKSDDPALVLLDALQGYIHAAVASAMDAPIGFVLADPTDDETEEPF